MTLALGTVRAAERLRVINYHVSALSFTKNSTDIIVPVH